ncbi:MAG: phosphoribosylglycinamide formyltransferase [Betaproteobacteria bacterium]|nr:phosphoribosylglycinamide formyltransferase [Betaproteobacteria bacterium]
MKKIVVLVSGRGSNMVALLDACAALRWNARITAVVSDRAEAPACQIAQSRGVPAIVVARRNFATRPAFDHALAEQLDALAPDLVVLAGFMQILPAGLVARYQSRMLNIHPSLLPVFPGLNTHRRVLESGAQIHGATVHYVIPELDAGPIVVQAALPVQPHDDERSLAARVLAAEHRILPLAVGWHLGGRLRIDGPRVALEARGPDESQLLWLP